MTVYIYETVAGVRQRLDSWRYPVTPAVDLPSKDVLLKGVRTRNDAYVWIRVARFCIVVGCKVDDKFAKKHNIVDTRFTIPWNKLTFDLDSVVAKYKEYHGIIHDELVPFSPRPDSRKIEMLKTEEKYWTLLRRDPAKLKKEFGGFVRAFLRDEITKSRLNLICALIVHRGVMSEEEMEKVYTRVYTSVLGAMRIVGE